MMWLSFGIGIYLSYSALDMYMSGKFTVEEYRVAVDVGGMFGNPNEMAMHFVMMTPLVITLGMASKSKLMRWSIFRAWGQCLSAEIWSHIRAVDFSVLSAFSRACVEARPQIPPQRDDRVLVVGLICR